MVPLASLFPGLRDWVLLFKPQFEVGREHVGRGGLVRDAKAVTQALADFGLFMASLGFILRGGPENSPLVGKKSGNLEHLIYYELVPKNPH